MDRMLAKDEPILGIHMGIDTVAQINKKTVITFFLLVSFTLFNYLESVQAKPEALSESIWEEVQPYLIPENHQIKKQLDSIFSNKEILQNGVELFKAGFRFKNNRNPNKVVVARHPALEGHLIKLFLENQPAGIEWSHWVKRIKGAQLISDAIEDKQYQSWFKVPQKWIYFLPYKSENPSGRLFVLVVEDMQIYNYADNAAFWKNKVTYEQIYMLWDLIETCGLFDSVFIDNIPYCRDRKIAFLDTEHYLKWPIPYARLNKFFKGGKKTLWKKLTGQE